MNIFSKIKNTLLCTVASGILSAPILKSCKHDIPVVNRIMPKIAQVDSLGNKIKPKNIMIVDGFNSDFIDVDFDMLGDISHGFTTSGIIENGISNANIYRYNLESDADEYLPIAFNNALTKIFNDTIKYDAINISLGSERELSDIGEKLGINLTPENLKMYRKDIRDYISTSLMREDWHLSRSLDLIDSIARKGTKIYVAAGNEGKSSFNVLSLSDNTISVGALDKNGVKATTSCDNSLVDRWENGELTIKTTKDGFNIFGGTQTDVPTECTTSRIPIPCQLRQIGTSFAVPRAIVKDFGI